MNLIQGRGGGREGGMTVILLHILIGTCSIAIQ